MEQWELSARECCRDTLAQYSHAGDRYLLDEFAAAFCEDGVLEIRGQPPLRGRAEIIERFGGATASLQARDAASAARATHSDAPRRIVRHNVTNIRFESVSPTEATVASYFTVFTEVGTDHMGRYRDRFVPVGDRWLLAHRFVSTDWRAPDSVFRAQAQPDR
ncbi:MAG TPA: nuclear transport factor 2 family protein [Acidimicrobiales bacterium]|nr:nuclear transport factor 2 family protein [Acidimicrobiales bacterium]